MFPKFNFKIQDRTPTPLFAHSGEAVVFWLSVFAVIFLGMFYVFRYFNQSKSSQIQEHLYKQQITLTKEINEFKKQQIVYQTQLAGLTIEVDSLKKVIAEQKNVSDVQKRKVTKKPIKKPLKPKKSVIDAFKISGGK